MLKYEEYVALSDKWETYKEQVRNGIEPSPSIQELLEEIEPKNKKKKLKRYKKYFNEDYAQEEGLSDAVIMAVNAFHKKGKLVKEIASIVGLNEWTVAYILTKDYGEQF